MTKNLIAILGSSLLFSGCIQAPNQTVRFQQTQQPQFTNTQLAIIGVAVSSDPRAEKVELLRRQKGHYWNSPVTRIDSTFVDGVFAYQLQNKNTLLVDENFGFMKTASLPWTSLDGTHKLMPESQQQLYIQRAIKAWLKDKSGFTITLGKGHKRKFLYHSALDCPYSKRFDEMLMAVAKETDVTIYTQMGVVHPGSEINQLTDKLVCAKSPQTELFHYRSGKGINSQSCGMPLFFPNESFNNEGANAVVFDLLMTNGQGFGFPLLFSEDGQLLNIGEVTNNSSIEHAKKALLKLFSEPRPAVDYIEN